MCQSAIFFVTNHTINIGFWAATLLWLCLLLLLFSFHFVQIVLSTSKWQLLARFRFVEFSRYHPTMISFWIYAFGCVLCHEVACERITPSTKANFYWFMFCFARIFGWLTRRRGANDFENWATFNEKKGTALRRRPAVQADAFRLCIFSFWGALAISRMSLIFKSFLQWIEPL